MKLVLSQTKPKTSFECLRNIFDCKKVAIGILVGIVESSEYYCTFEQKRLKNYRKGNFNQFIT
jgi:hypothetical protein